MTQKKSVYTRFFKHKKAEHENECATDGEKVESDISQQEHSVPPAPPVAPPSEPMSARSPRSRIPVSKNHV